MLSFNKRLQSGVTLVELLIAVGLGVVVIMSVSQGLLEITSSSRLQIKNNELQEKGDAALSYITFRLRSSLSSSCNRYSTLKDNGKLRINNLEGEIDGEEIKVKDNIIENMVTGSGIEVARDYKVKINSKKPQEVITDSITFISAGNPSFITNSVDINSKNIKLRGIDSGLVGESKTLYVITDCNKIDVFRAKPNTTSGTISSLKISGNINRRYDVYSSMVSPISISTFAIRNKSLREYSYFKESPGGSLSSGVELMRIIFSVDNNNDGIIDEYINASKINNFGGVILSAQIYLMVSLPDVEPSMPDSYQLSMPNTDESAAVGDTVTFEFTDKKPRKVFTRSVSFRNSAIRL